MAKAVRVPTTILTTGESYTARLGFGANRVQASVILDTGSATLAVDGAVFDPVAGGCATTRLMQQVNYLSTTLTCAVVNGAVSLGDAPPMTLAGANIGVAYAGGLFGGAQGIWGLAYQALDGALRMPGDTWQTKYQASQTGLGTACDIAPLFDQFAAAGLLGQQFAFRIHRAAPCRAMADPTADPLNTGVFVAGGGLECDDLYTGSFSAIAVVHPKYYNVSLLSAQVGAQPPITVQQPPAGSNAISTAVIDSGTPTLILDQGLHDDIIAAFGVIDPDYAAALQRQDPAGEDQAALDLAAWPNLVLTFAADGGGVASVTLPPTAYWQTDAQPGRAVAMLTGDGYGLGGQSTLGLPFFAGQYVVFDRSGPSGRGVVSVARGA
jgi:hypothetical protein